MDGILAQWRRERPDVDASPMAVCGEVWRAGERLRQGVIANIASADLDMAGFACAWHSRRDALRSVFDAVFLVLWPLGSALFLWFIAAYSVPTFDWATNLIGLGGIAIGVVPLLLNRRLAERNGRLAGNP